MEVQYAASQESLIKIGILKKLAGFFCKIFPALVSAAELKHSWHSSLFRLSCLYNFGSTFTFLASHYSLLSTRARFFPFVRYCFKSIWQFWLGIDRESTSELLLISLDSRQVLISADAFTHGCPLSQFLATWCLPFCSVPAGAGFFCWHTVWWYLVVYSGQRKLGSNLPSYGWLLPVTIHSMKGGVRLWCETWHHIRIYAMKGGVRLWCETWHHITIRGCNGCMIVVIWCCHVRRYLQVCYVMLRNAL